MYGTSSLHAPPPLLARCAGDLYLHCSSGPPWCALGLARVFMGSIFARSPALHLCTARHYCPRPEPCTAPAHPWVVCTPLDRRTRSPCIEFTAPHSTVTALHVCATFCPRIYTYSAPRDCVKLVFWTGFPHPAVPSALHHILLVLVSLGCSIYLQRACHFRENFWSASYVPSPVLASGGGEVCVGLNLAPGHSYIHLSLGASPVYH